MQARRAGLEALHDAMLAHSSAAELIVMNMPLLSPPSAAETLTPASTPGHQTAAEFLASADAVSKGFKRVLLIRGAGNTVVTADG